MRSLIGIAFVEFPDKINNDDRFFRLCRKPRACPWMDTNETLNSAGSIIIG
jgi:hypothetical protein